MAESIFSPNGRLKRRWPGRAKIISPNIREEGKKEGRGWGRKGEEKREGSPTGPQ